VSAPALLDLHHIGVAKAIGAFLLRTDDGWALVDCGPASTAHQLEHELRLRGRSVGDLRHLLLTHIHLDHAGAAGVLVRRNPELRVHVSEIGAPHLVDPGRLERSARRLYGEAFDTLWGELAPVPEENVDVLGARVLELDVFPAPGHASHQVCFVAPDGTAYPGDATGVRIEPGRHVVPYAPPPDIDVEAWHATLDELEHREPARIALPHFGVFDDVTGHVAQLRRRLDLWAERVERGTPIEQFVAAGETDLATDGEGDVDYYSSHSPWVPSFLGLERYWTKRREAAAA
jgi:glyoxylase-like metal-dependent hydrolase (beta-lactamase superfamily II)